MVNYTYKNCHDCDLLIKIEDIREGRKSECPRCNNTITVKYINAENRVIAFSITALIFLVLSNLFTFVSFQSHGLHNNITLLDNITVLLSDNYLFIASIIFITIIFIPSLYLILTIYIYISLKRNQLLIGTRNIIKLTDYLIHWNMAEIFLIGSLVGIIKIASLANVQPGLSFIAYIFFVLSMTIVILYNDKHQIEIKLNNKEKNRHFCKKERTSHESIKLHISESEEASNSNETYIPLKHKRIHQSLQKTYALLITSIILFIPANTLPIMKTNIFGTESADTIISGVFILWEYGSYPIAIVIFIASILIPIGKIIALGWLCYTTNSHSKDLLIEKTNLYRATEFIGRWSMADIFVVSLLVALMKLGNVMNIYPGLGTISFAGMVIVTMLATLSFDPRLIWDNIRKE